MILLSAQISFLWHSSVPKSPFCGIPQCPNLPFVAFLSAQISLLRHSSVPKSPFCGILQCPNLPFVRFASAQKPFRKYWQFHAVNIFQRWKSWRCNMFPGSCSRHKAHSCWYFPQCRVRLPSCSRETTLSELALVILTLWMAASMASTLSLYLT